MAQGRVEERIWVRVLLSPGSADLGANPYLKLLYGEMADSDIKLERFSARALLKRHDVVHVHWPEILVRWSSPWLSVYDVVKIVALVRLARRRGAAIVWTAHNLEPHDLPRPSLWRRYFSWFLKSLDLVVAMGPGTTDLLRRRYPELIAVPVVVVPHGHYRGAYPDDAGDATSALRTSLGLDRSDRRPVLLSFGLIRRYKNVDALAREWRKLPVPRPHLVVAGAPKDRELEQSIRAAVDDQADAHLFLRFISDAEVAGLFGLCDVVVIPYQTRSALNSGVAMLALSLQRPVVLTDTLASRDLQALVGAEWVHLCDGSAHDALRVALAAARSPHPEGPDLDAFEWAELSARTVDAYRRAVATRRRQKHTSVSVHDAGVDAGLVGRPYEVER